MKTMIFAAALAVSSIAMAQEMGTPTAQPGTPAAADTMTPPAADATTTQPAGDAAGTMAQPGMGDTTAGTGAMTQQTDPAAPATAPADMSTTTTGAGTTTPMAGDAAAMGSTATGTAMSNAPAAGDPSTYPVCSRTVKDRCINRGAKR